MRHFTWGKTERPASDRHGLRAAGWQRALGDDRGQTMVEMAVVLPAFFALLFGLFGFSVALFGTMNANYAVNTAVRYASIHSSTSLFPATTQSVQAMVTSNLYLPASVTPSVIVTHTHAGTLYLNFSGATVGDLTSVGVVWTNPPIWGIRNITIGAEGYRMVTH